MDNERLRRRADFLAQYRWGLAFGIAIAVTFLTLPLRPPHAALAYDLIPAAALGIAWILAGVGLGLVGRYWSARATAPTLPVARATR